MESGIHTATLLQVLLPYVGGNSFLGLASVF